MYPHRFRELGDREEDGVGYVFGDVSDVSLPHLSLFLLPFMIAPLSLSPTHFSIR